MTEPLPRDDVIDLLNRLGSDRDEDALAAARELHARITAAGASWEELLVPDEADADSDDDGDDIDDDIDDDTDGDDEAPDPEDEAPDPEDEATGPAGAAGAAGAKHTDSLALIDELLAKSDISTDLREELKGYKTDIAEGEFEARDRRYLGAIYKRLSKRR